MHVHQESYNQVLTKDWTCTSLSLVFYLCPTHWICHVYYMFWRLLQQCSIQISPWQNKQTNSLTPNRYIDYCVPNEHAHIYIYAKDSIIIEQHIMKVNTPLLTNNEVSTQKYQQVTYYPNKFEKCLLMSILEESITNTLI